MNFMIKVIYNTFLKFFKNRNLSKKYCRNSVNGQDRVKNHFDHFQHFLAK